MRLNLNKCKIMHFGKNNPKINHKMKSYDGEELIKIEKTDSLGKRSRHSSFFKLKIQRSSQQIGIKSKQHSRYA